MLQFKNEDEVISHAQAVLAKRVVVIAPKDKGESMLSKKTDKGLREYLAMKLSGNDVEHLMAFYFAPHGELIKDVLISKGTEKEVSAYPREVLRQGLLCNATYAVIAHNHPSGDSTPSEADSDSALVTYELLDQVDIRLLGAYVVAGSTSADVVAVPPPKKPTSLADMLGLH